jgi:drug/metabolite transporter (DMT)-like permease
VAGTSTDHSPRTPADRPAGVGTSAANARDRRLAELAVLIVMVFWAGNFIVVKAAINVLPPVGFTFLRYVIASVTLLVLLRWREGAFRLPDSDVRNVVVLGVVGFGFYQILWTVALRTIPAGDSALLIAATPVMTAVLAAAFRLDAPNPVKLIGAFVSFLGVALVIAAGQGLDLLASLGGDLLTLGAALCWAIYTIAGAKILLRHSPLVTTTWAVVSGMLFIAPVGIGQLVSTPILGFGPGVILALIYSGTMAAGFANVIVFHGVRLLGPTRVTALQSLVPALAVVLAAVFLHEPLRPVQVVGGIVILVGVALLRRGSWPARPRAAAMPFWGRAR